MRSVWSLYFITVVLSYHPVIALADIKDCIQEHLLKVLYKVSDPKTDKKIVIPNPVAVQRLKKGEKDLLVPQFRAIGPEGKKLDFRVVGRQEFEEVARKLKKKGFWVIFNPSTADARLASGHYSIIAGESFFNRMPDNLGAQAMISTQAVYEPGKLNTLTNQLAPGDFLVAQFFEISEESGSKLETFFHDRVWHFHENKSPFKTEYLDLPHTRKNVPDLSENCATFSLCFMNSKWSDVRPELKTVQNEVGSISISQIPNLQLYNNVEVPSYRSTLIIGKSPEQLMQSLMQDGLRSDQDGHQLLFQSAPTRLQDL